jgi:hypothetical protein
LPEKIFLANDYNFVMIVSLKLKPRPFPRLLKWIGRSRVEPAAAAFFPDVTMD